MYVKKCFTCQAHDEKPKNSVQRMVANGVQQTMTMVNY